MNFHSSHPQAILFMAEFIRICNANVKEMILNKKEMCRSLASQRAGRLPRRTSVLSSTALLATTASLAISCKPRGFNDGTSVEATSSNQTPTALSDDTIAQWNQYVQEEEKLGVQAPCKPMLYKPENHGSKERKGVVLMFSGYSSCPYQYSEIGPLLAKEGFYAFAPTNPGHGRLPENNNVTKPNLSGVPSFNALANNKGTWGAYQNFVNRMVSITAVNPWKTRDKFARVVVGLSVGGAEATYALIGARKNIFDRALILAPFYSPQDGPTEKAIDFLGKTILLKYLKNSWGELCERDMNEGTPRKGGFCSFQFRHLAAAQYFGRQVFDNLTLQGHELVQFIGVNDDKAINQTMLEQAALKVAPSAGPSGTRKGARAVHACAYPSGIPHAFISRTDNQLRPDRTAFSKPWIESFHRDTVNFVTKGIPFPTKKNVKSTTLKSFDYCELGSL